MSWRDEFLQTPATAPAMSVDDVFAALAGRDAVLYVDGGELRYVGPDMGDALQAGIDAHREILTEWFTYAPGKRCVFTDCYRLCAEGDLTSCPDHRAVSDAIVMPWEVRP